MDDIDQGLEPEAPIKQNGAIAVEDPPHSVADLAMPIPRRSVGKARPRRFALTTFKSLEDRNFRWFLLALLGQQASMNMQLLVRGYLVYDLTHSYSALGLVSLANAVPGMFLSLVGGSLADHVSQKKTIVQAGQLASALNAVAVAAFIFAGALTVGVLLVAAVAQGAIQSLIMPSRQAMIKEIAGTENLTNAVALNSASMNTMRLIAPAVGGVLLAVVSAGWVYVIMTLLFLGAAFSLINVPGTSPSEPFEVSPSGRSSRPASSFLEGLAYIRRNPALRITLLLNLLFVMLSMPYLRLLPGYVAEVMNEGPDKLGYLMSITGVGALVGALIVASLPPKRRGILFLIANLIQGIGLLAFSTTSVFLVSLPIMLVIGFGQAGRQAFGNVLVQHNTEDAYRGRVMSIYMLQMSLNSFAAFGLGLLSAAIGAQVALGASAVALIILACGVILFVPTLRKMN